MNALPEFFGLAFADVSAAIDARYATGRSTVRPLPRHAYRSHSMLTGFHVDNHRCRGRGSRTLPACRTIHDACGGPQHPSTRRSERSTTMVEP